MRFGKCAFGLLVAVVIAGGALVSRAEDKAAADQPKPAAKAARKEAKPKAVRLTKPWNTIASLTDEQKSKIAELHKKSVEEQKEVVKRENEAIMAVLNDQQKAELQATQEKEAADKKMKKPGAGDAAKSAEKDKEKSS